jgi:hypothetical protein
MQKGRSVAFADETAFTEPASRNGWKSALLLHDLLHHDMLRMMMVVMTDMMMMMTNMMMVSRMLHDGLGRDGGGVGAADHRSREGEGDREAERGEKGLLHGHFLL